MSGLNFNITANNSDFKRKLQEVDASVSKTTKAIEASGQSVESYFRRMTAGAAALAAGFSARELVSNIVRTRGEMQQLEVAFTTMLQSGERASALLADAVEFRGHTAASCIWIYCRGCYRRGRDARQRICRTLRSS